ncbi:hypothetical protein AtNW77_Chr3g0196721 [Arabidopsis thaliana]
MTCKNEFSLSGIIIEGRFPNILSDAGGALTHRRREISNRFKLSYLCISFVTLISYSLHQPHHHSNLPLITSPVLGEPLTIPSKVSSLRRSIPAATFDDYYPALVLTRSLTTKSADPQPKWYHNSPILSLWITPVPQPPAKLHSILIFNSPRSCRHSHQSFSAATETLGFPLLGLPQFSPFWLLSRPNLISDGPTSLSTRPNFCLNFPLFFLCQRLCRSLKIFVRGQLIHNQSSLLCWYKSSLRAWLLESPLDCTHVSRSLYRNHLQRLRKDGIMIPSPRCGDYRNFLTFQSPSPLFTELFIGKSINGSDKLLMLKTLKLSELFEFAKRPLLLINVIMSCDNDQSSTSRIDRGCVSDLPSSRMWHCVLQPLSPS